MQRSSMSGKRRGSGTRTSIALGWGLVLMLAASRGVAQTGSAPEPPVYPKRNVADGYVVDASWPSGRGTYSWGATPGVAVDGQDNVWMFTRSEMPVQVYAPDGKFLRGWGRDIIGAAHHIRIDPDGNVWCADTERHVVRKFTPGGDMVLTLGVEDEAGSDERHLFMPTDIAIAADGDLFVTDGYGNNRVVHFDARGKFVKTWGKLGVAPGEFSQPHAIAIDSADRLYVVDRNNARIQVFDRSGKSLDQWRNLVTPWGIWITPQDEIFVCGASPMLWAEAANLSSPPKDQILLRFDPSGRVRQIWTFPAAAEVEAEEKAIVRPGELAWVHAVAVDSKGNVFMGDIRGERLQKFVPVQADASAVE